MVVVQKNKNRSVAIEDYGMSRVNHVADESFLTLSKAGGGDEMNG